MWPQILSNTGELEEQEPQCFQRFQSILKIKQNHKRRTWMNRWTHGTWNLPGLWKVERNLIELDVVFARNQHDTWMSLHTSYVQYRMDAGQLGLVAPEKIALNMVPQWMYLPEHNQTISLTWHWKSLCKKLPKLFLPCQVRRKKSESPWHVENCCFSHQLLKEQFWHAVIRAIAPKVIGGEDRAHKGLSKRHHQNMCRGRHQWHPATSSVAANPQPASELQDPHWNLGFSSSSFQDSTSRHLEPSPLSRIGCAFGNLQLWHFYWFCVLFRASEGDVRDFRMPWEKGSMTCRDLRVTF